MKKLLFLVSICLGRAVFAECDCTIIPFKPDPPCFKQCVGKILASASHAEMTGKYGIPDDIADRIIDVREHGGATSVDWYKKALSRSDASRIEAIFRKTEHSPENNPKG